jgi:hypothetical protein
VPARPRLSLDGQWLFWLDPSNTLTPDTLDVSTARRIAVPSPWQAQAADLRFYSGTGWYQRTIEVPPEWPEGTLVLGFGAADYTAEVWVNGQPIGQHEGGYLPFEFDVTSALRPGPNTLTVRIADNLADFAEVPHGKQSWYGALSGLWQSVWLERRSAQHLGRLRVTPYVAQGQAELEVTFNQGIEHAGQVLFEIFTPLGELVSSAEAPVQVDDLVKRAALAVPEPHLWDVDDPFLYTARATLKLDGGSPLTTADILSDTFGFRTIETRDGLILLNGRPIYLRGALDQDYYPDLICTPPSLDYILDSFRKAKAMGLNCLRVHIKVADPRYYYAADQVGLLIWTELPNWGNLTIDSIRRGKQTILGMLTRDWNHPCIVIWTIINEDWGTELYGNPQHRAWLAEMYNWVKSLDPLRLIVDNSPCFPSSHVVTDINDFHFYSAIPDQYREWRRWVEAFASQPSWTFAHAYEGITAWRQFSRYPWRLVERQPSAEVKRLGAEPLVVSEFGNWGLPDVEQLRYCQNGAEPWWFETGMEWAQGTAYPHGLEARYVAFHLDRIFPTIAALSAASQRMQFTALKYEIEQMRRQPRLMGYVITEFTDAHWEANGLLDMCRNPKVFYEAIGALNADDLIIPDWERVAYWEGERCTVRLSLSHFSRVDLTGARLEWSVAGWPDLHGSEPGLAPQPAGLTSLRRVSFKVPSVTESTPARLEFKLFTADDRLVATNYETLYFFPRASGDGRAVGPVKVYAPDVAEHLPDMGYTLTNDRAEAEVMIVRTLTDDVREYLQAGGQVLWLPASSDSLQTYLGDLRVVERADRVWEGNWVGAFHWINREHMFQAIPTDGLVDFAFADVIPELVIQGLRAIEYATNVHAGLTVGWLHRTVATVAEKRIGDGRLLISTFRLAQNLRTRPVAAIMLRDLVGRLAQRQRVSPTPPPVGLAA